MFRRRGSARPLAAAGLAFAMVSGSCSIALVDGPPRMGEADHDPTGRYASGVPCTGSRTWPIVDAVVLLATLVKVANYGPDQRGRDPERPARRGGVRDLGVDRTPADERLPRRAGGGGPGGPPP